MLSDEEKHAIEGLKGSQKWIRQQIRLGNLPDYNQGHYADIQIVLNIIKKQSKEIEELKDKCKELIFEKQELTSALLDSTPNDKIKAKIEELEKGNKNTFIRGKKILVLQSLLEKERE